VISIGSPGHVIFLLVALFASDAIARLPNHTRTPGVTNPEVTQETISQTICVSGWTATVRPPSSYTTKLKTQQIREYRYKEKRLSEYEEDHLISLQLGGHPTDPQNLWPQPYRIKCGARIKDVLETKLKRMVCDGRMTLAAAQKAIATNWIAAYKKYVDKDGCPQVDEE
jgi:hypothetical protein